MRFTVYGKPQPAGSKRGFVNRKTGKVIITDDAKSSRPWKQEVAGAAVAAMGERSPWDVPLEMSVTFYFARPKSHLKADGAVKPKAPGWPSVRPDTTKLVRAVEDALTGIIFRDDALVVDQIASKRYGSPERCEIEVTAAFPDQERGL